MKFVSALLLAACAAPSLLFSQAPPPPPADAQPDRSWHEKMRENNHGKFLESLPPDVRERFEAAREKAMQDPNVKELKAKADAAGGALRAAVREAMRKTDPGLAEILKKNAGKKFQDEKDGGKPGAERPGPAQLSEGDRQKLMAARETAKSDPAVQAAEEKKKAAATPEDRRAATDEFFKAMRAAVLKADPSLEPILDQLKAQKGPPREKPNDQNPSGGPTAPSL